MAIRKIAQMGEPVLRCRAADVPKGALASPDVQTLIDDMIETMHDADGAGIAAPQVYVSARICVIEIRGNRRYPSLPDVPLTVFVNPVVTPLVGEDGPLRDEDAVTMFEGCLSVQGLRGRVRRPRRVRVQALDRQGQPLDLFFEGVLASVIQHEVDHLDGVLYVDRVEPETLMFLREYERHVPLEARIVDGAAPPAADERADASISR